MNAATTTNRTDMLEMQYRMMVDTMERRDDNNVPRISTTTLIRESEYSDMPDSGSQSRGFLICLPRVAWNFGMADLQIQPVRQSISW